MELVADPKAAVEGADVLYTDVWTSMGQDDERERRLRDLAGYGIDADLVALAAKDAIVLHCLPAHYGEEISEDVLYGPQLGGLGRGREPPSRPEGFAGARDSVRLPPHAAAEGQRPDPGVSGRHDRADRGERARLVLGAGGRGVDYDVVNYGYYPCSVHGPCEGTGGAHLPPALVGGHVQLDVHARKLDAHPRQHALPLDLREQRRGRARPIPFLIWYLLAGSQRRRCRPFVTLDFGSVAARASRISEQAVRSPACWAPTSCCCRAREC